MRQIIPLLSMFLLILQSPVLAQTELKPGFNLFSPEQDVEIGQKSAEEIERQLPVMNNAEVQRYISRIGDRLVEHTPGPDFPYQFRVVNLAEVNAFALPGGFMYVHRGLIEAAKNEGELAGVMGHEIAHVALRHGTNQASKAYLASAGFGILGAIFGGGGGSTSQIIQAVGGFGLNSTFLKFSRDAERQSDLLGAQILAKAGYDPMQMADFFETLSADREQSGLETFFSSHPAPENRSENVQRETQMLRVRVEPPVGNFDRIKSILKGMPDAPSMQDLAEGRSAPPADSGDRREPVDVSIETPSSRLALFQTRDRVIRVRYPDNWTATESEDGSSVSIIPRGGQVRSGQQFHIVCGALVNRFEPFTGGRRRYDGPFGRDSVLDQAANELLGRILSNNNYLQPVSDSESQTRIDGRSGVQIDLVGQSPVTGQRERVEFHAVGISDSKLLYCLLIAPERDRGKVRRTFEDILDTLRIED